MDRWSINALFEVDGSPGEAFISIQFSPQADASLSVTLMQLYGFGQNRAI